MAVTYSATGAGGGVNTQTGSPKNASWSHTAASGDYVLVAVLAATNGGGGIASCSATYGGVAMTLLSSIAANGQPYGTLYMFGIAGVAAGAATIAITAATGSGDLTALAGGSVSYAGVGGVGTPVTASGVTGGNTALTPTNVAGGMVVAALGQPANGSVAWTGFTPTQRYNHAPAVANTDAPLVLGDGSATGTVSIGANSTSGAWVAEIVIPLLPATTPPNLFFMAAC